MPLKPFLAATAEQMINRLLAFDPDASGRLSPLEGKRLSIHLTDINQFVTLAFSDRIDILTPENPPQTAPDVGKTHCIVTTRLSVLPKLSDTSQLTLLIKAGELEVAGELSIAQHFSGVLQALNIDWEEILAQRTSDVFAYQTFALAKQASEHVKKVTHKASAIFGSALTDEKQLAAHRLAVLHFSDEVSRLRDDAERFEARLSKLEGSKR